MVYEDNYDQDHRAVAIGGVTIAVLAVILSHAWDDILGKQDTRVFPEQGSFATEEVVAPVGKLMF
jgi:hypothetical protein